MKRQTTEIQDLNNKPDSCRNGCLQPHASISGNRTRLFKRLVSISDCFIFRIYRRLSRHILGVGKQRGDTLGMLISSAEAEKLCRAKAQ